MKNNYYEPEDEDYDEEDYDTDDPLDDCMRLLFAMMPDSESFERHSGSVFANNNMLECLTDFAKRLLEDEPVLLRRALLYPFPAHRCLTRGLAPDIVPARRELHLRALLHLRDKLAATPASITRNPSILREVIWPAATWQRVLAALPDCPDRFLPELLARDDLPEGALRDYPCAAPDADTEQLRHPHLPSLITDSIDLSAIAVEHPDDLPRALLTSESFFPEIETRLVLFLRRWISHIYARHPGAIARRALRPLERSCRRGVATTVAHKFIHLQVRRELRHKHLVRLVEACAGDDVDDTTAFDFFSHHRNSLLREISRQQPLPYPTDEDIFERPTLTQLHATGSPLLRRRLIAAGLTTDAPDA